MRAWPTDVPYTHDRLRYALALSRHETGYGYGWGPPGDGSHNMGAITAGGRWSGATFSHGDSRPEGGEDVSYTTDFRAYDSREAGWADLVRVMIGQRPMVAEAIDERRGIRAVADALYRTGYYAGSAQDTPRQRVTRYADALRRGIEAQAPSDDGARELLRREVTSTAGAVLSNVITIGLPLVGIALSWRRKRNG